MYFMVFFEQDHIDIIHTLTHEAIHVPKKDIGSFIDMLLDAQDTQNAETGRVVDSFRRASWLNRQGQVFVSELAELGIVIPIQKQAAIARRDVR